MKKSELAEKSLSDRIYYAIDGTIGHVMTLIRKGATLAIEQDLVRVASPAESRLDLNILGVIYDQKAGKQRNHLERLSLISSFQKKLESLQILP